MTCSRKAVEVDVLGHVVNRDIETRGVSHVEDIERELQGRALGYFRYLRERNVRAPLPGLAENITLAVVDEVRLVSLEGIAPFKAPGAKHNSLSGHFSLRFAP